MVFSMKCRFLRKIRPFICRNFRQNRIESAIIIADFQKKGCHDEYQLYASVERLAKEVITQNRKIYKGVCANVDFYSGFVYRMLGLPMDLFTPIFAIARIAGWSAHRLEELINCRKIIRPAYLSVAEPQEYVPLEER